MPRSPQTPLPAAPQGLTFLQRIWATRPRGPASWAILAIGVAVVLGTTTYLRQKNLSRTNLVPDTKVEMEPHLELKFDGVVMRGRDKGISRWEIRVPEMTVSQNQRVVYFNDHPRGKFLNLKEWDENKPPEKRHNREVDWVADAAQYDNDFQELSIRGKAVFTTDEKDVLETEQVIYRQRENIVLVPTPFKLESHDRKLRIQADQATADTKLEVLEMAGRVQIDSKLGESDKL